MSLKKSVIFNVYCGLMLFQNIQFVTFAPVDTMVSIFDTNNKSYANAFSTEPYRHSILFRNHNVVMAQNTHKIWKEITAYLEKLQSKKKLVTTGVNLVLKKPNQSHVFNKSVEFIRNYLNDNLKYMTVQNNEPRNNRNINLDISKWAAKHQSCQAYLNIYPLTSNFKIPSHNVFKTCKRKVLPTNIQQLTREIVHTMGLGYDHKMNTESISRDTMRDLNKHSIMSVADHDKHEPAHRSEDRSVADELAKKVRVLCWIMTYPENHKTRAQHVKATWGKRCNKLIFMSTKEDPSLPTVKLPLRHEGRQYLWGKTKAAFRYVYEHHRGDADWFMKADDDTYVIVENLRYMLADYKTTDAIYFGCRFKMFAKQGYMSGGAGYVLSRMALHRLVNYGLLSPNLCKPSEEGEEEDVLIGLCLENIGVKAMDSRDSLKRGRFFTFMPAAHLFPAKDKTFWYWSYQFYPDDEGLDCCSDHAVSFHYVQPQDMYLLDYFIYHLRPYGISYGSIDHNVQEKEQKVQDTPGNGSNNQLVEDVNSSLTSAMRTLL